jgi:hypothetical protein
MPNWCANSLKIVATTLESEQKLAEIIKELTRAKDAGESPSFFNLIKPIPEELNITSGFLGHGTPEQTELERKQAENLKKYGYADWYSFCIAEWGTKWDAKTADIDNPFELSEFNTNELTIYFDTAWSPPLGIYSALENMGFDVQATYVESGVGFIGYYSDGVDTCHDMEALRPDVDDEDDDYFGILADNIDGYFAKNGFDHSPCGYGG